MSARQFLTCAKKSFAAFFVMAGVLCSHAEDSILRYSSRQWQSSDGLPHTSVHAIAQTRDGYLWVGTQQGLARFDGMHFTVFNEKNVAEIKNSQITALCAASDGSLWIATEHGGIVRLQNGKFFHIGGEEGLPADNAIRSLCETRDGAIWIATTTALCRFKSGKFSVFDREAGLSSSVVRSVCEDREGNLWIATANGVHRMKDQKVTGTYSTAEGLRSSVTRTVFADSQGQIWIGQAGSGVDRINGDKVTNFSKADGLADMMVTTICEDRSGTIWIGSYGGLNRFVNGKLLTEFTHEAQPFDMVNCIFEDREGNLWVGAKDGLYRLQIQKFLSYTKREGLSHYNVISVIESRDGAMWFGTWGGPLNHWKNGTITAFKSDDLEKMTLSRNFAGALERVLALHEDSRGGLWVGTDFYGGLFQLEDGQFRRFGKAQGLAETAVRVIHEDQRGALWVGTSSGLFVMKKRTFRQLGAEDGFSGNLVRVITEDRQGHLWVGSDNGLSYLKGGQFTNFTTHDGLSHNSVSAIYHDADNNIWIGTRGGGLNRARRGSKGIQTNTQPSTLNSSSRQSGATADQLSFTTYTTEQGLLSDDVFEILEDDFGNLWMTSRLGVFCIAKKDFDEIDRGTIDTLRCRSFDQSDGLISVECNSVAKPAAWKAKDGRLWFATTRGVAVTDPKISLRENQEIPPVFIEEVFADRKPEVTKDGGRGPRENSATRHPSLVTFPPGRGELEFHFTALSFVAPEKVRFKYKLEGVDSDWFEAGPRRSVSYNNILPGSYRFRVMACNNDGIWNKAGTSVAVVLLPHYWQTWWFKGSLGACALLLASAAYRTRMARLRELERLRLRIAADLHDELGSSIGSVSLLARKIQKTGPLNDEQVQDLSSINRISMQTANSLRDIVWFINPEFDTMQDLLLRMKDAAATMLGGLDYRLEGPKENLTRKLPLDFRRNIFLMFKEILNNISKHSQATSVEINISETHGVWQLSVRDNGVGFEAETATRGNGLKNLRRRAEKMKSEIQIKSQPGAGTTIVVSTKLF